MTEPAPSRSSSRSRTIYLDHAATSWPKPQQVLDAVIDAMGVRGANPGRGAYAMALAASRLVFDSRRACAELFGVPDSADVAFLSGCTEGCNLMLKGLLEPGDRVVVSSMEHNAITRPLHVLAERGVRVVVVQAGPDGLVDAADVEAAVLAGPTRAVVCQHASNITGAVQPIPDLADIAHENGALLLVDGAQGAGHLSVDLPSLGVDAYVASGHKGLLGPQGVGLLYLRPGIEARQLLEGGTGGGSSEDAGQPTGRPERYEAGTPNTPGIAGLAAAARLLLERGEAWRAEEQRLFARLKEGLLETPGVRVLGTASDRASVPVLSIVTDRMDPDRLAFVLDRRHGVAVRSGLHCAPWAHRTLGTLSTGALRFGVGHGNTDADIDAALHAVRKETA
ncbi:MAG: aminotransferase class V-fold PLP-dependent enzyme [Coriobacteriia bacterium]|nr:aminotransferase class V-fold PLP-dependent enzyme [Coriobacteriia bacterium]